MSSVLAGTWSDNLSWEFFVSDELSDNAECSAVYCLAILKDSGRIVLTRMHRGWEMLGGHIEPGETIQQALVRECTEEGGYTPQTYAMFGYNKIIARRPEPHRDGGYYPLVSYIPYFVAVSDLPLLQPTGAETIEARAFDATAIAALHASQEPIIRIGLQKYADNTLEWSTIA